MKELIDEMQQHVKLVIEYQTLIARCAPQSQAAVELKALMVKMMTWIKAAKSGAADMWAALDLCYDDETRAFELARNTLNPYQYVEMDAWYEVYCERLAELE